MSALEHLLLCKKENAVLRAEVERLREEVAMYRSALANALGIALPMPQPPEKEE